MNTKEYIASGILEMYVLGVTSAKETLEVEAAANKYPEIKTEIDSIRNAIENYALANEKNPPLEVKEEIRKSIKNEKTEAKIIPLNVSTNQAPLKNNANRMLLYLVAASLALLITSTVFNYIFYTNWKNTETQLVSANSEKDSYANQMQLENANYQESTKMLHLLTDSANKVVKMMGMAIAPKAMATVYWNTKSKTVCLHINNLPMPPANKQYQLWAMVNGKPVSEGVFEMGKPMQMMQPVSGAQAFAVTLEKKGGSKTPNMTAMYVLGNV